MCGVLIRGSVPSLDAMQPYGILNMNNEQFDLFKAQLPAPSETTKQTNKWS